MCSSYKFPIGFCCVSFLLLGASVVGINKDPGNWSSQMYNCLPGCLETFHSHLKNLFNGTCCYHLFSNCHYISPCSLKDLPSTNFINFLICGMSSCIPFLSLLCNACSADSSLIPGRLQLGYEPISPGTRIFSQFPGLRNEREKRNTCFPGLRTLYDNLNM